MAIIDNLNTLSTNLDNAKFKLAKNLKNKGVQALPSDKLDALADKIVDIQSGSCNLQELDVNENGVYTPQAGDVRGYNKVTVNVPQGDMYGFDTIGYNGSETVISDGVKYAKQIADSWDATQTNMEGKFKDDTKLIFFPKNIDVSKIINSQSMFASSNLMFLEDISFDSDETTTYMFLDSKTNIKNVSFPNITWGASTFYRHYSDIDGLNINLKAERSNLSNFFNYCNYGVYNNININLTNKYSAVIFADCSNKIITNLNLTQDPTSTSTVQLFKNCQFLTELSGKIKAKKPYQMFYNCSELLSTPIIDVSYTELDIYDTQWFYNCKKLNKIIFEGDPKAFDIWSNDRDYFSGIGFKGELIYDIRYDYSRVLDLINSKGRRTWTMKPNVEITNCKELSITADDCIGNDTTTTVHYRAVIDGRNINTNEIVTDYIVNSDGISEPFEKNPSLTDSRQITVTFNFFGTTATATITQSPRLPASATVDLKDNWELAPAETIPNPDPNVYEGVYQSIHKGQGNVRDIMTISFIDMPNFELYIRSNAESNYDYVYAGKLDEVEPTEYVSTRGNQQAGTDLASYTKVEYPNDGGRHTVSIVYRKDTSGEAGDDRGYVFFKKPQQ